MVAASALADWNCIWPEYIQPTTRQSSEHPDIRTYSEQDAKKLQRSVDVNDSHTGCKRKKEKWKRKRIFLEVGLDLSHVLVTIGLIACVLFYLPSFDGVMGLSGSCPLANFLI